MLRCRHVVAAMLAAILIVGVSPIARAADAWPARNRAAALLDNGEDAKAIEAFRDLTKRFPDSVLDRVNLGIALINHNDLDSAETELRAALVKDSADPRAHYNLGLVLKKRGKNEEAAKEMAVVAATPEGQKDATVWYQLGLLQKRLRRSDEALASFRKAVALRPEHGSAHFQLYNELIQRGEKAAAQPELEEFKVLQKATPEFQRNEAYLERGAFTKIAAPGEAATPEGAAADASPVSIKFEARGRDAKSTAAVSVPASERRTWNLSVALTDFDGDGALDIAVAGEAGRVRIYRNEPAGTYAKTFAVLEAAGSHEGATEVNRRSSKTADPDPETDAEKPSESGETPYLSDATALAAADVDNDGDPDLLVTSGSGARLFINDGKGRFADVTKAAGLASAAGAAGAAWTDVDRDGDLDLVLGALLMKRRIGYNEGGPGNPQRARPRLFLNAGLYSAQTPSAKPVKAAPTTPAFLPAGPEAVLPEYGETVVSADLRGRGDPDLIFGFCCEEPGIAHNLRGGRFSFDWREGIGGQGRVEALRVRNPLVPDPPFPGRAQLEDLDGDGDLDLFGNGIRWNDGSGLFPGPPQAVLTNPSRSGAGMFKTPLGWASLDADGDGLVDLAALVTVSGLGAEAPSGPPKLAVGTHLLVYRNEGSRQFTRVDAGTIDIPDGPVAILSGDLDGDGDPDVAIATPDGPPIVLVNVTKTSNRWLKVALKGGKTNRCGIGAKIEVRADRLFASRESDGNPTILGIGPRGRADAVRVVWTSGITQDLIDVPAGPVKIEEKREFSGSCPFLYAWDGRTFRFVGEALSGAPIGFLRPDGAYESPRPTEHLRLPPGMPAARDGRLSLRMTEEMRELSALDGVRLVAVDHPENVEVYSNERLTEKIEPFVYVAVADLKPPDEAREETLGAPKGRGAKSDATAAIAALDDRPASGFATLGARLEGLAEPHVLDLNFRSAPAPPSRLALVLDGWVAWTTSDVSRALLQATGARAGASSDAGSGSAAGSVARSFAGTTLPPSPSPWGPALEMRSREGTAAVAMPDMGLPIGPSMLVPLPDAGWPPGAGALDVRIGTNLAVYYARIRLGRIVDAPLTVRELPPIEANLRWRGVAAARRAQDDEPPRPDYDAVSPLSPFPLFEEGTTAPGDVLTTVQDADRRMAVFGTGEEITLEFDAHAIPPPAAGMARTWFLASTGYARDGDPNTKPLPWGPAAR